MSLWLWQAIASYEEPTKTGRSRRLEDKVACITVYALLGLSWESALVQIAVAGKVLGTYMLTFDDMHYNNLLAPAKLPTFQPGRSLRRTTCIFLPFWASLISVNSSACHCLSTTVPVPHHSVGQDYFI